MNVKEWSMEKQVEECKTCKDKEHCPTAEGFPYCTKKHDSVKKVIENALNR